MVVDWSEAQGSHCITVSAYAPRRIGMNDTAGGYYSATLPLCRRVPSGIGTDEEPVAGQSEMGGISAGKRMAKGERCNHLSP
jgi:hypothetical protein